MEIPTDKAPRYSERLKKEAPLILNACILMNLMHHQFKGQMTSQATITVKKKNYASFQQSHNTQSKLQEAH